MRASRLLVAVLALALLGLVPASTSASAAQPSDATASRMAPSTAVSARAGKLTAKVVKRKGKLFLTGVIRPKRGPVVIQKATKCNEQKQTCNFKNFSKSKINKKGRYTARIYAPRSGSWAWRAKKAKQVSNIWITCVKRPGATCPTP